MYNVKGGIMNWNEVLRALREDKDFTQKEMAQILNTTQRTISNWENGRNQPPYEILIKYAKIFEVSTDYILGLSKEPKKKLKARKNVNINQGSNNVNNIKIK